MKSLGYSLLALMVAVGAGGCAVPQPSNTPVRESYEIDPTTGRAIDPPGPRPAEREGNR